ncbi:hypothetical protein Droror1_Dr00005135 [Drosera rotundifolia]
MLQHHGNVYEWKTADGSWGQQAGWYASEGGMLQHHGNVYEWKTADGSWGQQAGWYASEGGMLQHHGNVYEFAPTGLGVGYGFQQSVDTLTRPVLGTVPLPPNAASTLYVRGLPPDSTRREVAHIFRHFMGYKEVRLVTKPNKFRGEDFVIVGFVKFENPAFAATALSFLQGYVMDEKVPSSPRLRIQFARSCGRQHMTKEPVKGKAEETKEAVRETAGRAKDKAEETSSDGRS